MILCKLLNYHIIHPFPAVQIRFPAFADDVSTKTTGFLQKIIDFLTDIRKRAITIIALVIGYIAIFSRQHTSWIVPLVIGIIIFIVAPYIPDWLA